MSYNLIILLFSSFSVGFIHTLMGPDHYIPFIAMSKARQWSIPKTVTITTVCGIGHVMSAFVLGIIAVSIGIAVTKLNFIESIRGELAAWFLIIFGLLYFIWGIRSAFKHHGHSHSHHKLKNMTPWILFVIFVLGPCEPLIPLIIYPAVKGLTLQVFLIVTLFGFATIFTMLTMVLISVYGTKLIKFKFLERYGNAVAGVIICCCGLAIKFVGI